MYKWEWCVRKILGKNIIGKPLDIQSERSKEHVPSLMEQTVGREMDTQVASKVKDKRGHMSQSEDTARSSCRITPISQRNTTAQVGYTSFPPGLQV